uniref:O-acyltransferase n=1 Tax=Strigamia maritima TaxID=126957 RepID=T1J8F2_STRMM
MEKRKSAVGDGEPEDINQNNLFVKIMEYAESLKQDTKETRKDLLRNGIVDECIDALNKLSKSNPPIKDNPSSPTSPKNPTSKLKEKEFVARESLLTELFEINHFGTIRNIFTSVFLILFVNNIVEEYFIESSTKLQAITGNFKTIDKVFYIWMVMFVSTLILVHISFQVWAYAANKSTKVWNKSWLTVYVLYLCAFFYFPTKYAIILDLTPVCSMIILAEQLRMMMKTHSFVRHNAEKILDKPNSKQCPAMSKYLYFLFVPTLIYRDEYPRTSHIRVKFVLMNFCQVIACIFYISVVLIDHFLVFHDFGLNTCTKTRVIQAIVSAMVPGTILFFCANFLLLHSWMNAFAEMLRFADRQFYTDWWNSYNFAEYYRTWNIVVHDWLYTYVFRDLALLLPKNRLVPLSSVFIISSIVHDYIMTFTFRVFMPVFLIMFGGIGGLLFFVPHKGSKQNGKIFFWTGVIIGTSIMTSLYSIEWYARQNCPPFSDNFLDLVVPRMWVCYRNASSS